jgi:PKD repeat protein
MKNIGHFCTILLVVMVFMYSPALLAQRASAEFIASIPPSRLETGQELKDGIQNLIYQNNLLYVVNTWAGIQVVDVTNREKPKEIGRYQNDHRAHNLFLGQRYGYLSDELEGVHILDMSTPSNPVRVGKIATEGNAFWVVAEYPYVFVAEEEKGVTVYDITNVSSPVPLGNFNTPGWAWELILRDNILYVADKSGGLQILDVTNKNNLVRLGQLAGPKNARSMSLEGNQLFLADGAESIYIIDVSNPKFPAVINKMPVDGYIASVFKSGKNLFMANETNKRIDILDVSNLPQIQTGGTYQADDKVYGLWKEDVYLFVAANSKSLILRYNSPPKLSPIPDVICNEQEPVTVQAEAFDPDGDVLFYEIENIPEGAAFDTLSGTLTWTPTYEQSGVYKNIIMRVIEFTDSRLTDEKSFSITVNHVNRPPKLPEVEDYTVKENELLTIQVQEGTDEDREDQGKLVYSAENLPEGASFDPVKRIMTWTPTYEQSGTYMVDFVLSDQAGGFDRDASTITVLHVDRKPVITAIGNKTVKENETLQFVVNGSDPDKEDQNAISYEVVNMPKGASFDQATRTFKWTPGFDDSGEYDNMLVIMHAGNMADTTAVDINVAHVDRQPTLDTITDRTIDENKTLHFMIAGSDPDKEDSGKLVFSASNLPPGATFNPDSLSFSWTPSYEQSGTYANIDFTVTDPSGKTDSKSMTITVNHVNRAPQLAAIEDRTVNENVPLAFTLQGTDPDQEDQNSLTYSAEPLPEGAVLEGPDFSWTPTYEQSGSYTIKFKLSDGKLSDTKTVNITVIHINRPPLIAEIPPQVTDENKKIEFKVSGSDPDQEDNGTWKLTTSQLPEGAQFDAQTATFSWTPTYEQAGTYTITFTNTDAAGLTATRDVQITVNHVNRTPVLNPIPPETVAENTLLNVVIPAGEDPDKEDAQKIVYEAQNLPEGASFDPVTRTLTWTPTYEQSGTYEIPVTISDGEFTVTQSLQVTVTHVNRAPVLEPIADQTIDENQTFTYNVQASDPDKEDDGKIQVTASNLPQGMTFDAGSRVLAWTPTYEQSGNYPGIQVSVKDPAGLGEDKSFSITVNNVNRPPEITSPAAQKGTENAPVSISIQATDPDQEDQGKLKFSATDLPSGASLDPATGSFSWTPNYTQAGSYTVKIAVTDAGGLQAETNLSIEISDLNRAPVLQNVGSKSVNEGEKLTFTLTATDEDTDNQLSYSIENLPDGATLDQRSGTFSWTPAFDQAGSYNLSAKVSDGTAESTVSVPITVNDVNRAPQINGGGSVTVTAGERAVLSFSASDPDDDKLSFESNDLPDGANLDAQSGDFSWTPSDDQTGTFSFTVSVSDGKESAQAKGSVKVNAKPVAPPATEQTP